MCGMMCLKIYPKTGRAQKLALRLNISEVINARNLFFIPLVGLAKRVGKKQAESVDVFTG